MDWLVYVDPSPRGEWALALAAGLPDLPQASVCLLATAEDVSARSDLLSSARARLARAARVEERALAGPGERAVLEEARRHPYDLLVVPPAGRGAIRRMIRGSRIATVVRSVRAPVLVARRPPPKLERVLAALSGGTLTAAVASAAVRLGDGLGAAVAFVHVVSEVALPFRPHAGGRPPSREERGREDPGVVAGAALRSLGREEALLLREGLVVEEVLAEFENGAYDLLVIGAREEAGWGREDVTERILLHCPGSMLVVPR